MWKRQRRHQISLRLLEKTPSDLPDAERLEAVRQAVASVPGVEWLFPPAMHPRGGFTVNISVMRQEDLPRLIEMLDEQGYGSVI